MVRRPSFLRTVSDFVLGEPSRSRLPERVREAIEVQQRRSELLIVLVQIPLIVFFAILYAISPKTFSSEMFAPVPWTLAGYFAFSGLRLILTLRPRIPAWLPFVSVVVEIALLLTLIWSFHIQYEQPAPFYLKAPTMLYIFIFIALRTLRFDPLHVLVGGAAGALGWLALVAIALASADDIDLVVTRDYVLYMTSNTVLIGAEVDKMVVILSVTAVLALALVRAKRLMHNAIVDNARASDLSRFITPEVAQRITGADRAIEPGYSEVREGTILFTDIEGFSGISERITPQTLMTALNEYFAAVAQVLERHHGVIHQYHGDAMLVAFNTLDDDPDHAANALRTALAIQQLVNGRTFGDGLVLKTRCGINTGTVVVGAFGGRDHMLFTVHGDAVNIAARLEQLNKSYGTYVLASEATIAAAGPAFNVAAKDSVAVRGRISAIRCFEVESEAIQPQPRLGAGGTLN